MKDKAKLLVKPDSPGFSWLARALGPRHETLQLSDEVWTTIEPLLEPHGITGLLFDHIQRGTIEAPDRIQFDLAARLTRWSEATRDWPELACLVLDVFRQKGIPHLVLKGWALIPLVYGGNRELRETSDLDLLIPRANLSEADAVLRETGFAIPPQAEVWPGFAHRFSHEAQYVRRCGKRRPMGVDLHWQATGSPQLWPLVGRDWCARAREVQFNGHAISIPATEDLFLHLCVHQHLDHARDPMAPLFRQVDLLRVAKHPDFSWKTLLERARSNSLTGSLKSGIEALRALWPESVPTEVLQEIKLLPVSQAEKEALQDNLSPISPLRPSPRPRWIPGWKNRLKYFCGKLFPSGANLRAVHHLPPNSSYARGLMARYGQRIIETLRAPCLCNNRPSL